MNMTNDDFNQLVKRAIGELSKEHVDALDHVSILIADEPSEVQLQKLKMRQDHMLLGLFEGVPRTRRSGYESGLLPDTITIFKKPLTSLSSNERDLFEHVKRTVWHEIAHYYGLSHDEMDERQRRSQ